MTAPFTSALFRPRSWLAAMLLACFALASHAAVLVAQAPRDAGDSYQVGLSSGVLRADNFNLANAVSLQGFQWWGGYAADIDALDDVFTVDIYSDVTGTGTVVQSFVVDAGNRSATAFLDLGNNQVYMYEYTLLVPVSLVAGAYHLSISNNGSSDWLWLASADGDGTSVFRLDDPAEVWAGESVDLAFTVLGEPSVAPVSEPAGLALLGVAGLALFASRRLQR